VALLQWATLPVRAEQSACDPSLRQAPENPWGYRPRGERCEGIFLREVSGEPLRVVACTEGEPAFSLGPDPLLIQWRAPRRDVVDGTLRLRAESLRHRTYYRMDAVRPLRDERFSWPSEVLLAQGLQADEIALSAGLRMVVDGALRVVLQPLRVASRASVPRLREAAVLTLWPSMALEEIFLGVQPAGTESSPDLRSLGAAYQPAERPVRLTLPPLGSGVQRVRVAARLRGGGNSIVDAWVQGVF
jgi:hypothetical protein